MEVMHVDSSSLLEISRLLYNGPYPRPGALYEPVLYKIPSSDQQSLELSRIPNSALPTFSLAVPMRFSAFFVPFLSLLFLCVGGVPSQTDSIGGMTIGQIINILNIGLVQDVNAIITVDSLTTNLISVNFDAKNPLPFELTIDRVVSSAGLNGTTYATFDQKFSKPVVVPPFGSKNSGTFGNVLLVKGVEASLDIIPFGVLDLSKTDVSVRAGTILGFGGISIPIEGLKQTNVPTTYNLDIGA